MLNKKDAKFDQRTGFEQENSKFAQELIVPKNFKSSKTHKGESASLSQAVVDVEQESKEAEAASSLPVVKEKKKKAASKGTSADLLEKYFREIRRYPLLSREKEFELASQLQEQEENSQSIAYRLITANLRLVVKIAKEYQSTVANLMDLIQEGNVGLIKAVDKFDPHKGVRLGTYAQWWIRAYILKYLVNNARLVKVGTTQAQRKLFFSLNKEKNRLKAAGFKPEPTLIAKNLGVGVKDVKEMEKRLARPDLSMDLPVGDEQKSTVGDLMINQHERSAEEQVIGKDLKAQVNKHLNDFSKTLKDREQILWEKRLMAEDRLTLREIGDMFGLTRERARQIEKGVLTRLRSYLQSRMPELDGMDWTPALQAAQQDSTSNLLAS